MEENNVKEVVREIKKPRYGLRHSVMRTAAAAVLGTALYAAGWISHTPTNTNYSVKEVDGVECLVDSNNSFPIQQNNDFLSVGDLDYRLEALKDNITKSDKKNSYTNSMVNFGLANTSTLSKESIDSVLAAAKDTITTNSDYANDFLSISSSALSSSELSPANIETVSSFFYSLAEQDPVKHYQALPDSLKQVCIEESLHGFRRKITGRVRDFIGKKSDSDPELSYQQLKESYFSMRDKIGGGE